MNALKLVTAAVTREQRQAMFTQEFLSWFRHSCVVTPGNMPMPAFRLEQARYADSTRLSMVCYTLHPYALRNFEKALHLQAGDDRMIPYYTGSDAVPGIPQVNYTATKYIGTRDSDYEDRLLKLRDEYRLEHPGQTGMYHMTSDEPPETISTAIVFLNPKRLLDVSSIYSPTPAALPGAYEAVSDKYDGITYLCGISGRIIALPPGHTYPMFKALKSPREYKEYLRGPR